MNNLNLLLSFLVASVQLADAYLRYLALRKQMSPPRKTHILAAAPSLDDSYPSRLRLRLSHS